MAGWGLRYFLRRGPEGRHSFVERMAEGTDARPVIWWTDDEDRAHRFNVRHEADAARIRIAAEEGLQLDVIPEA